MKKEGCVCEKCLENEPLFVYKVNGRESNKKLDINICFDCDKNMLLRPMECSTFLWKFCEERGISELLRWTRSTYHKPVENLKNNEEVLNKTQQNFTVGKDAEKREGLTWSFNGYRSAPKVAPSASSDFGFNSKKLDLI